MLKSTASEGPACFFWPETETRTSILSALDDGDDDDDVMMVIGMVYVVVDDDDGGDDD